MVLPDITECFYAYTIQPSDSPQPQTVYTIAGHAYYRNPMVEPITTQAITKTLMRDATTSHENAYRQVP